MDYSPLNPTIWIVVAVVVAIVFLTVRIYHTKYPNYPNEEPGMEENDPD